MKMFNYLLHPQKIILFLMDKRFFDFIPDKQYLKIKYFLRTGKKLDLVNPHLFNEKLQWLKLYDRKDIYTIMVDKFAAKQYVEKIIGKQYIIPTIGLYNSFEEINFNDLPSQFVMKCTHDSGGIIIVKNKKEIDFSSVKKKIKKFLKRKYYYVHREWPYKNVVPKIIIEKYMKDKVSDELIDYKVMCFNGIPKIIFTCTDRFKDSLKVTFFDLNWNKMPFERKYPSSNEKISKPVNLNEMLKLSKKLAQDIPFVRIDWYEINGELYFGELTFFPGSGYEVFNPIEWDKKLGDMLELNLENKNEK